MKKVVSQKENDPMPPGDHVSPSPGSLWRHVPPHMATEIAGPTTPCSSYLLSPLVFHPHPHRVPRQWPPLAGRRRRLSWPRAGSNLVAGRLPRCSRTSSAPKPSSVSPARARRLPQPPPPVAAAPSTAVPHGALPAASYGGGAASP